LARGLATEEKDRLAKLGTFVEIEDLIAQIGDELAQNILSDRADEAAATAGRARSGA
jgi:hypothetical protein